MELPGGKTPELGKPEMGESGVQVGAVMTVVSKGEEVVLPVDVSTKHNLLPAKECSTISDSDISSNKISELFSEICHGLGGGLIVRKSRHVIWRKVIFFPCKLLA